MMFAISFFFKNIKSYAYELSRDLFSIPNLTFVSKILQYAVIPQNFEKFKKKVFDF